MDRHRHTRTDAKRFYYLSHAICYSYGADNNVVLFYGPQCSSSSSSSSSSKSVHSAERVSVGRVMWFDAGVGGNLVAVQASRMSTELHRVATPGHLPDDTAVGCITPWSAFFGKSRSSSLLNQLVHGQRL